MILQLPRLQMIHNMKNLKLLINLIVVFHCSNLKFLLSVLKKSMSYARCKYEYYRVKLLNLCWIKSCYINVNNPVPRASEDNGKRELASFAHGRTVTKVPK